MKRLLVILIFALPFLVEAQNIVSMYQFTETPTNDLLGRNNLTEQNSANRTVVDGMPLKGITASNVASSFYKTTANGSNDIYKATRSLSWWAKFTSDPSTNEFCYGVSSSMQSRGLIICMKWCKYDDGAYGEGGGALVKVRMDVVRNNLGSVVIVINGSYDGKYHLYTLTYDSINSRFRGYKDGLLIKEKTATGNGSGSIGYSFSTNGYFTGDCAMTRGVTSEVIWYNYEVKQTEIQNKYMSDTGLLIGQ